MVVFDFEILRETDLDNVIWREIGAAPFYYSCFLGMILQRMIQKGVDKHSKS